MEGKVTKLRESPLKGKQNIRQILRNAQRMNDGERKRTDIAEDDERQNSIKNKIVEEETGNKKKQQKLDTIMSTYIQKLGEVVTLKRIIQDAYQTAKIGTLLTIFVNGKGEQYRNKDLAEVDIDANITLADCDYDSKNENHPSILSNNFDSTQNVTQKNNKESEVLNEEESINRKRKNLGEVGEEALFFIFLNSNPKQYKFAGLP
ncbi:hypothetical protein FQA39_LY17766 [Lamprigera yunnana]|nr:hypothetical protein FQA39_LY17766 [Lamprigera yunnana]